MIDLVKNKMIEDFVIKYINNLSYSKWRYKYLWYLHQNISVSLEAYDKKKAFIGFSKSPV